MKEYFEDYILTLESGGRPKGGALSSGEVISLGAEHLSDDGNLNLKNLKFIPEEFYEQLNKGKVQSNDILIVKDGATTGKTAFVNGQLSGRKVAVNEHLFLLRPNEKLHPKYLFYFLYSNTGQKQILSDFRGSTVGGISRDFVKCIDLPIPDLPTQKQIAQILEEADIARQKRKVANVLTDQFLQSTFLSMFGDPSSNEKNWERGTIRQVVSEVKYGTSKPAEENGNYPYLRMNNIDYNGNWDFSSLKFINLQNDEREKYLLQKGDLVFNRTNSKELVGKTAIYNLDEEMAIAGYLIRVRTNERADPYYLWAYLNSKHGKSVLFNMCKNIVGMANINAQELQDIQILIPPIGLQQKFASIVADTEQLRQKQKQSEIELENLFQALLQRYFG